MPKGQAIGYGPPGHLFMLADAILSEGTQAQDPVRDPGMEAVSCTRAELMVLVYRQMRSLAGPRADLEDLAQSALEQVLNANFEGRSRFSTFTHAVCYRVWMKHLRSGYRFRAVLFGYETVQEVFAQAPPTPHAQLEATERLQHFYAVLSRVSPKRRAVVTLHDINGERIPDIASIVGANEATVRTRLRDGRRHLRKLLAEDPYFATELQEGENR